MADEILNIDYHRKILVKKALSRSKTFAEASKLLNTPAESVRRYANNYNLRNCLNSKRKR